jgi:hypothetical protein
MPVIEKKPPVISWERDVPASCKTCGEFRYVSALAYAAHADKREIERLIGQIEAMKNHINIFQDLVREISGENRTRLQAKLDDLRSSAGMRSRR